MKMFRISFRICLITFLVGFTDSLRILGYFPTPSISHQVVFRAVVNELASRGHELVVITPDPENPAPPKVTQIDVHDLSYGIWINRIKTNFNLTENIQAPLTETIKLIYPIMFEVFEKQMALHEVKSVIYDDDKFDLILIEDWFTTLLFLKPLKQKPIVAISSFSTLNQNFDMQGVPSDPLIYVNLSRRKLGYLNLWDRVKEIWYHLDFNWITNQQKSEENKILQKLLGSNAPSVNDLARQIDLTLLNVQSAWDGARPLPPNVLYFGGSHLKPLRPLPQELKQWLDDSKEGVIYFSLGSNIKSSDLPSYFISTLVKAFSAMPHRILWKWESDSLPRNVKKPANVRLSKWLPQADLLFHPNILAFVTQGGLQSTDEALRVGLPLVGIPFWGDQMLNVARYEEHGIGIALDVKTLTHEKLINAILKVVKDKSYRQRSKHLGELLAEGEGPESGLARAAWWIEHVARYGGDHLRAPVLSWYDVLALDVLAALALAILIFSSLLLSSVRYILKSLKRKIKTT